MTNLVFTHRRTASIRYANMCVWVRVTVEIILLSRGNITRFFGRLRHCESKKSQNDCRANHRQYIDNRKIDSKVYRAVIKDFTNNRRGEKRYNENTPCNRNTMFFNSLWRRGIILRALMRTDARSACGDGFAFGSFCFLCHNIQYIYPLWRLQTQKQGEANAACL